MQLGCGVYEITVRGRAYLYFWHYEDRGGRSVQVKEYVGPAHSSAARDEAARRSEAYYRRARDALTRMRNRLITSLAERT